MSLGRMNSVFTLENRDDRWLAALVRLSVLERSHLSAAMQQKSPTEAEAWTHWNEVMSVLSHQRQLWILSEGDEALAAVQLILESSPSRMNGLVTSEDQRAYGGRLAAQIYEYLWNQGIREPVSVDSKTRDLIFSCW